MPKVWDIHLRHLQYAGRHNVQGLPGKGVGHTVLSPFPARGWDLSRRQFVCTP